MAAEAERVVQRGGDVHVARLVGGHVQAEPVVLDRDATLEKLVGLTAEAAGKGATLTLVVNRRNGERVEVPVTCRLDSDEEVSIYEAGGVLQRFAQDFLEANKAG